MHLNGDARQIVLDRRLYDSLMSYAEQGSYELAQEDRDAITAIRRHVLKFNPFARGSIPPLQRPEYLLEQKQQYAKSIRQWACRSGSKAYLRMSTDGGAVEYHIPVTIMGRSALDHHRTRFIVVRPFQLNLEQYQALSRNRRITGGMIHSGIPVKFSHHPITGSMVIHANWMNDCAGVMNFAASPSFLKLQPPEGSHECHGGILDGIWRSPPFLSTVNPSDQKPTDC